MVASGCTQFEDTFGSQASNDWALQMTQADQLQDEGLSGNGTRLAVVDSGVDASHREFDGVTVRWKDFVNDQNAPYDDHGHGTHVSGLAVAQGTGGLNNPEVRGTAPSAMLLHAKAIKGASSSNSQDVANGIDWAVNNRADVLVLSLGERPRLVDIDNNIEDAVDRALEKGVVVVASAGNAQSGESGKNCDVEAPASIPLVIAVGAVDREKNIAPFSCTGGDTMGPLGLQSREDPNKKPEVSAPGVELIGPWPGRNCAGRAEAKYCINSGTSQAAPIVGGIVAMLLEEHPDLKRGDKDTVREVKRALTQTAEKPTFVGHDDRFGYGIVQGADALDWLDEN